MRVVLYCRVSRPEEAQINSLGNQIAHYQDILKKDKNYKSVKVGMLYSKSRGEEHLEGIFADEGISGTKRKNRRAFEYMMKCAKNGEFDIVYCKNISRFARNVADGANDLKTLKSYGVNIIFEDGNLSFSKDEAIVNILLTMAQEESRAKSKAIQFGIRKAQGDGKWTSNCPYGYDRTNGYLKINVTEADIVREIYSHYVNDNWGQNKIVKWLNNNQTATKKSGGKWYQQHVVNILTNPLYKGIQTTHKSENNDVNLNLIKEVPEEEWIVRPKDKLKIVPEEIWLQAQDIAEIRTKEFAKGNRHSDVNLFSTIFKCGNCKGVMRRKKAKTKINGKSIYTGKYQLVCQNNDLYGSNVCSNRNMIDEQILIKYCKEKIEEHRQNKELLEATLNQYIKLYYSLDTRGKLNEIESKMNELNQEYDNRIRLNTKGLLQDERLEEFYRVYRKELVVLQEEHHKLQNIDNEIVKVKRKYYEFIKYIDSVDIDNLSNASIKKIFSYITITSSKAIYKKDGQLYQQPDEYTFYNKSKDIVKYISHGFNFMDTEERTIFYEEFLREMNKWEKIPEKERKTELEKMKDKDDYYYYLYLVHKHSEREEALDYINEEQKIIDYYEKQKSSKKKKPNTTKKHPF